MSTKIKDLTALTTVDGTEEIPVHDPNEAVAANGTKKIALNLAGPWRADGSGNLTYAGGGKVLINRSTSDGTTAKLQIKGDSGVNDNIFSLYDGADNAYFKFFLGYGSPQIIMSSAYGNYHITSFTDLTFTKAGGSNGFMFGDDGGNPWMYVLLDKTMIGTATDDGSGARLQVAGTTKASEFLVDQSSSYFGKLAQLKWNGSSMFSVDYGGCYGANLRDSIGSVFFLNNSNTFQTNKDWQYIWSNDTTWFGVLDTGIKRESTSVLAITDGSTGIGKIHTALVSINTQTTAGTVIGEKCFDNSAGTGTGHEYVWNGSSWLRTDN